jgi:hypothetical protein
MLSMPQTLDNDDPFSRLDKTYLRGIIKVFWETKISIVLQLMGMGSMIFVHLMQHRTKTGRMDKWNCFKKNSFTDYYKKGFAISTISRSWFITDALTYEDLDFTIQTIDRISKIFWILKKKLRYKPEFLSLCNDSFYYPFFWFCIQFSFALTFRSIHFSCSGMYVFIFFLSW